MFSEINHFFKKGPEKTEQEPSKQERIEELKETIKKLEEENSKLEVTDPTYLKNKKYIEVCKRRITEIEKGK